VSVVVTVKVSEGLVLVADSAGTIEGEIKGPGVKEGVSFKSITMQRKSLILETIP
jgi:hypothetical protein